MALNTSAEAPIPVGEVSRLIGGWIDRLGAVWVEGQITQLSRRPGAGVVFLTLRDASHDVTLPKPLSGVRAGSSKPEALGADYRTVRLDDQHAYLDVPPDSELQVGDMICFGISHPCTTFDRWQAMYVADDDLNVVGAIRTYF